MLNLLEVTENSTGIEALYKVVVVVVGKIITLLGTVCTALISNPIFQIMFGIMILMIVISIVFKFVRKVRRV